MPKSKRDQGINRSDIGCPTREAGGRAVPEEVI